MRDPIEGQFRVLGEKPPYEPIIKDWRALWTFLAVFVIAVAIRTGSIMLENDRLNRSSDNISAAPRDAGWSAAAEQAPARTLALDHLP